MAGILDKLKGGDLRSIGRSEEVVEDILANPTLFTEVLEGLFCDEPVIRARSADALEKVSTKHPEYLQPHKTKLWEAAKIEQQEVQWHVAQMMGYVTLTKNEQKKAVTILSHWLDTNKSNIVRVMSLQTLADMAMDNDKLKPMILEKIEELLKSGIPSLTSRAKKLAGKLKKSG
jgi:CheY-like chemotaxis protein